MWIGITQKETMLLLIWKANSHHRAGQKHLNISSCKYINGLSIFLNDKKLGLIVVQLPLYAFLVCSDFCAISSQQQPYLELPYHGHCPVVRWHGLGNVGKVGYSGAEGGRNRGIDGPKRGCNWQRILLPIPIPPPGSEA